VSVLKKNFKFNFIISFIYYAIICVIGFYLSAYHALAINRESVGIIALIWFFGFPLVSYFFLGMTLRLLGNNFWNYLSVSGGTIFSIAMTSYGLLFEEEVIGLHGALLQYPEFWGEIANVSFGRGVIVISDALGIFGYYVLAVIPSLLMWFGLTIKSKGKIKEAASVANMAICDEPKQDNKNDWKSW